MTTNRSDLLNNSMMSTNRLLTENDNLNIKYNQYRRNFLNIQQSSSSESKIFSHTSASLPDCDSDIRYTQLKKLYDDRVNSLYVQLKSVISKLQSDDLLSIIRADPTNNNKQFIQDRVIELLEEGIVKDQEVLISRLSEENAELRSQSFDYINLSKAKDDLDQRLKQYDKIVNEAYAKNQLIQNENSSLRHQIDSMQNSSCLEYKQLHGEYVVQITKQNNEINKLRNENSELNQELLNYEEKLNDISREYQEDKLEMDRLQKVISVLEIDLNQTETKIREKSNKIESLQHELTKVQSQLFESNLKIKKLFEENRNLQSVVDLFEKERKDILEKCSSYEDDFTRTHYEKLEQTEKRNIEKFNSEKIKFNEMKEIIKKLEDEIKLEQSNAMKMKLEYSKMYSSMHEDMKLIKSEWEKKVKNDQIQFEKILSEIEHKHNLEIQNLKNDQTQEIENKMREINKLKQSSDLLKNFEKEYIRISAHEEIIESNLIEMRKKTEKDFLIKEEEIINDYKKRVSKLEEDKRGEYEFLTENLRKNLKNLEKMNEELKSNNLELNNKLMSEKDLNQDLENSVQALQKNNKNINAQIENKNTEIKNLNEKLNEYDAEIKNQLKTTKNIKSLNESLAEEIIGLKNEKNDLVKILKEKEENHNYEISKCEKIIKNLKEAEKDLINQEKETISRLKLSLQESENIIINIKNENSSLLSKFQEMKTSNKEYENTIKNLENRITTLDTSNKENNQIKLLLENRIKKILQEKNSFYENIIKIHKTKISNLKFEINQMKINIKSQILSENKELVKIVSFLESKTKKLISNLSDEQDARINKLKEKLESEYKYKIELLEKENQNETKKIESKFEKHILEQFRNNERLEKETKNLSHTNQENLIKIREQEFRFAELNTEIKNLVYNLNKAKDENSKLTEIIEKLEKEKIIFSKKHMEKEEDSEKFKREGTRTLQNNLSSVFVYLTKMKKKYENEILNMKNSIIKMIEAHKGEIQNNSLILNNNIDKTTLFYENKISLLESQLQEHENIIYNLKNEIKNKENQLGQKINSNQDSKSMLKNLKTQLELKTEEIQQIKYEYDKLIKSKEKKLLELQGIINKSLYSYNTGVNNIKIANKLDDEVKILMKRAKVEENI